MTDSYGHSPFKKAKIRLLLAKGCVQSTYLLRLVRGQTLPRKSVSRFTDLLGMASAVILTYWAPVQTPVQTPKMKKYLHFFQDTRSLTSRAVSFHFFFFIILNFISFDFVLCQSGIDQKTCRKKKKQNNFLIWSNNVCLKWCFKMKFDNNTCTNF